MTRRELRDMDTEIERYDRMVNRLQDEATAAAEKYAAKSRELAEAMDTLEEKRAIRNAELRRMQMAPWIRATA